jgi:maltooligosyltrehalose trehalohydrolase
MRLDPGRSVRPSVRGETLELRRWPRRGEETALAPAPAPLAVWAPAAARIELCIGDERHPMSRGTGGVWTIGDLEVLPGTDYAFSIDGGPPRPDPRSAFQPQGVHGPSRVVDHDAYTWHDAAFRAEPLASGVLYELHVGTFTPAGTFRAAVERLDHLAALGVTHVELMPLAAFAGERGWGYDGVALYAPHAAYGTPDDLKRLVDECHARHLAVILDVVYNHLGPSGNYLPLYGPYFTAHHRTPWGDAVNLEDAESDGVRRFFMDSARQWLLHYHFDGLRVDAVHALNDRSAVHFVEELAAEVHALGRDLGRPLVVVAESDLNDPRVVREPDDGGWGCDAQWSDDFHHALHVVLTGERSGYYADFGGMATLAKALARAYVYDGQYAPSRRRRHGRPADGVPASRFLAYSQNHDQVGNRAAGERLAHLVSRGRVKIAAAVTLLSPFVPLLFQGEEWAASAPFQYFTDHEPELGAAVTRGRREEFGAFGWSPEDVPDPQSPATFVRSKLDWDELPREPQRGILDWYRRLIRLRRRLPELGPVTTEHDEARGFFRFDRAPLSVAFNVGTEPVRGPLPGGRRHRLVLTSDRVGLHDNTVELPPDSVAVVIGSD